MNKSLALLNGITPAQFLADYWQKKPLLIRQAIPNFTGLLSPNDLAGLACEDDVQARIIKQKDENWTVENSPFDETIFAKLPKKNWTLLVQSVNHYLPEAADLLALFNFIPHARLDDLMVSYAPIGGGVGAHVDSYDVFLLQGAGKRNWKISSQKDLTLVDNQPIKVLKHFEAEQEWTLEAGDMLYLPPQIAHWGVSQSDDCMTYSIGFRAPKKQELAHEFLSYLQDSLHENAQLEGLYEDADLTLQQHPAEITSEMTAKVAAILNKIHWDNNTVADFLGRYLSEPKPDIIFTPARKIRLENFTKKIAQKPCLLDLKSQLLWSQNQFYLNGELLNVPLALIQPMLQLANTRQLDATHLANNVQTALADVLLPAYLAGYLQFD
jgi:50S ribosomal protein L16 3-hydroxylase